MDCKRVYNSFLLGFLVDSVLNPGSFESLKGETSKKRKEMESFCAEVASKQKHDSESSSDSESDSDSSKHE
jgi:hypothetical protein